MSQGPPTLEPPLAEVVACPCGHLPAQHDAVATRHCGATLAAALRRTCVCIVTPTPAASSYDRR
jgi:hypothetical protein